MKGFDPKAEKQPDHPLWARFQRIAGNTPASRDVFARILSDRRLLQQLDRAEGNPADAVKVYREECMEIGRQFTNPALRRLYPYWDRIEGAAFLLLLGSYPDTTLTKQKQPVSDYELGLAGENEFLISMGLGNGFAGADGQATYAVTPGFPNPPKYKEPVSGTDRVFAKLLAAWLPLRTDTDVLADGFHFALRPDDCGDELLPFARQYAASKTGKARAKIAALMVVANSGTVEDLPLFEALYENKEIHWVIEKPVPGTRPAQATVIQNRDVAIALALLLYDQDPLEFGFENATNPWAVNGNKRKAHHYASTLFGFSDDKARAAAHKKARAFLSEQKQKEQLQPTAVKLVEQLGSAVPAERAAAEKALKELGAAAKPALLAGTKSDNPEVARRCAMLLSAVRKADWQRAKEAFAKDPATFDHPVWQKLNAVAGDGADAREALADLLADETAFVAVVEALDDPKAAPGLHRAAHARLTQNLKDWYAADKRRNAVTAMSQWSPDRGAYPALLLLGTFPGTEAAPAYRVGADRSQTDHAEWHVCWFGLTAKDRPKGGGMRRPSAALQRLFVAWLGARENPDAAATGFSTLLMSECREGAALARTVAADAKRTPRARGQALLYLGSVGTAADAAVAATAFSDTREFASTPERTLQVRDLATAAALKLSGEEPADWGFSVGRGASALKSAGPQTLGFASDFVRDPFLKAAQKKVAELLARRAAPPPNP